MIADAGFRAIFELALDPMLVADDQARYVDANPAACAFFALSREELCTRRVVDFAPAEAKAEFDAVWQAFLGAGNQRGEYVLELPDGRSCHIEFSATANVLPGQHLSIIRDISERKRFEREREELIMRVRELALTDPLTELPNRRAWNERLLLELRRPRHSHEVVMIAVLDLDGFKRLNDARGHAVGDQLLHDIAARWQSQLREGELLARVGGDEFCLLVPDCSVADGEQVLQRLLAVMPEGQHCSVGVAVWDTVEDAAGLFERADHALYDSKGLLSG
jgi:diguanylate cyclase (GGDEF)-like protein/PAS domain S-box-containing protein